jgi:hypothetical protein
MGWLPGRSGDDARTVYRPAGALVLGLLVLAGTGSLAAPSLGRLDEAPSRRGLALLLLFASW